MRLRIRVLPAALIAATLAAALRAQPTPIPLAPAATPPPPADVLSLAPLPTPTAGTTLRIVEPPLVSVARLPAENPYGVAVDVAAQLPPKLVFSDAQLSAAMFVSVHVDPAGRQIAARRDRDPIPSLAAETQKSLARWTFTAARRGSQTVDTWGAYRLDLTVDVSAPKVLQTALVPVTPATTIPKPLAWGSDNEWLESRKPAPASGGAVPIEDVDTAPLPQKTPWSADSYKGNFGVKYWVKVSAAGRIERVIPLEVTDPVLLPYFRRVMAAWTLRPAQAGGKPVDSWNELFLSGTVSYSVDLKQIAALRRSLS